MVKLGLGRLVAVTAGLGLTLAMAACSSPGGTDTSSPTDTAAPTEIAPTDLPSAPPTTAEPIPVSTTMDGIDATGGFGDSPDVTVPFPWAIDSTQVKILVQGTGLTCSGTGLTQVNYYGVNARSGDTFDESYSNGSPVTFDLSAGMIAGFIKAIEGQQEGTRLITAIPGADGYDSSGGNSNADIQMGDTLVFVIDIVRCEISEPTGEAVTVTDTSLPTVGGTLDAPTVTIPAGDPPTSLVIQPLIKGPGAAVEAADFVKVNYAEYTWSNGQMVRQTFGFTPLTGSLSATIQGWQTGLLGQTVGSRLLLVVPPDQAYPQGNPSLNIPSGSTMVYVIDIMFAAQS